MSQVFLAEFDPADIEDIRNSILNPQTNYEFALRDVYRHLFESALLGVKPSGEVFEKYALMLYQLSDNQKDFEITSQILISMASYDVANAPSERRSRRPANAEPNPKQDGWHFSFWGVFNILVGIGFIAGGLSGNYVLKGTGSGGLLAIFGVVLFLWGLYRLRS
jgi:hypothetical protein